ncbi:MAG: YceI family protein [Bacteroidota bacterium]
MKKLTILSLFAASVLMSCGPKTEGTDAEVSEAKEVSEASLAAANFNIDTDGSQVTWIGSKPVGKHNGFIPISEGSIKLEEGNIVGGSITINVTGIECEDLASDSTMQAKLEGHLLSDDFFAAEEFPTAEFVITSVENYSAEEVVENKEEIDFEYKPASASDHMVESPTHKITGNLTMRGTTLSISFPASVQIEDNAISAKAKFNIDRTRWGLSYGEEATITEKAKDKFIYNTVNVGFDLKANADAI